MRELVAGLAIESLTEEKDISTEIKGISIDTRQLEPKELFIALVGHDSDGHRYLKEAARSGAAALLIEKSRKDKIPPGLDIPVFVCQDTREILPKLLEKFYGVPSDKLRLIGITGTNGKTTTTHLLESIFKTAGETTGLIGTIVRRFAGRAWKADRTTPSVVENYRCLSEWADRGCTVAIMEVSSHGLEQGRVEGLSFAAGGFTNLSRDHLDYHENMEQYYRAKRKLFEQSDKKIACSDDDYGLRLAEELSAKTAGKTGDYRVEELEANLTGISFKLITPSGSKLSLSSSLTGLFNYKNISLAAAVALELGVAPADVSEGVSACEGVPGRCEKVLEAPAVFVDYAHTAEAMENLITSIKPLVEGKIIVVFGAGGDRDRGKRPDMGKVASDLADYSVLTSDNPRGEEPRQIFADVVGGMQGNENYHIEADRGQAIREAITMADEKDTVLIVGKGHETEQIIGERVIPFDDASVAREVASTLG
jgi:UDP-N-acetylmuramoyl-L-alanyl-D-glutamate--2,6-diaminopimelate ligase